MVVFKKKNNELEKHQLRNQMWLLRMCHNLTLGTVIGFLAFTVFGLFILITIFSTEENNEPENVYSWERITNLD